MKKKLIPFVLLGLLSLGAIAGCNGDDKPTTTEPPVVTPTTPDPTVPDPTTPEVTTPEVTTPAVVHVESVDLEADKTTLYVGQTANLTVSVLPENADDKTYVISTSDDDVASVSGNVVTAEEVGEAVITVTTNDGAKTDTVTITVDEIPDPVITVDGSKELSVAAGSPLALPTVTAADYDNTDLTSYIEIEDLAESGTVNGNTFTAKIAGTHEIVYYVETEDGRWAEEYVSVNVTPATPEAFDVTNANDPNAIATYGVYKENFEKGRKAPLYAALNDSNGSSYLTSTSEAIQGNSLVVNFNKTSGSAANSLFLSVFNDIFLRDYAVTYKVSFDYKVLSESVPSDIYFGLSWDGSNGLNIPFLSNKTTGQVNNFSCSFPATKIPAAGNAYFFFFQLSGSNNDSLIAIDNFVFETVECAQVTEVTPTAEQLQAEGGFTWDFANNGATSSNGETVIIDNLANADAKAAMKADADFGENALKLTNADGHLFSGLTKNNMIAGKKLSLEMKYYAVNDDGFHLIMMVNGSGSTLKINSSNEGNMYTVTYSGIIEEGSETLNIYGAGNSNFEIYIGYINAAVSEPDPIPENQTPKGHKVGESYTQSSRAFGYTDNNGVKLEAFDGNEDAIANEKMGSAPSKLTAINAKDVTIEWYQTGNSALPMEKDQTYTITVVYYVVECNNRFMMHFDKANFTALDNSVGFHEFSFELTPSAAVDFFCFYIPDAGTNATIYIAHTTVTLTKLAGAAQTDLGYEVGQVWNYNTSGLGYRSTGALTLEAYDGNSNAVANAAMGSAPDKMVINGKDCTHEYQNLAHKVVETGHSYDIKVTYFVESWEATCRWMLRIDGAFHELDASAGFHEVTINHTGSSIDWISFYISGEGSAVGVIYIGGISITLTAIN